MSHVFWPKKKSFRIKNLTNRGEKPMRFNLNTLILPLLILSCLLLSMCENLQGQSYILKPSENIYVSQGATKSVSNYSGTLGLHYFFTDYFGVSLQGNFINEFGWYHDFTPMKTKDVKLVGSIGYSAVHNSISYSLRICIQIREFYY